MNVRAHRALLADHERSRRARVRQALLGELPGLEVEEAGDPEALVRSLEDRHFDMTIVRHPFPSGEDEDRQGDPAGTVPPRAPGQGPGPPRSRHRAPPPVPEAVARVRPVGTGA